MLNNLRKLLMKIYGNLICYEEIYKTNKQKQAHDNGSSYMCRKRICCGYNDPATSHICTCTQDLVRMYSGHVLVCEDYTNADIRNTLVNVRLYIEILDCL